MTTLATLATPQHRQHPLQHQPMPPKPRREFLAPLKSLVRSLSGNNLAAKNKKDAKPIVVPAPQPQRAPEKLVKGRRRATSFWAKKPSPPYYGDTQDLRYSSADQLASTLRESFRAVGFQDVTPYDNPALGLGTISRQSSHSRLSVNPLATPNMPTIIFSATSPRSPSTLHAPPSPLPPPSPSRSRPPSRPPSRPGTPGTMELRFDLPAFLPPPPKHTRNGSNSSSDFGGGSSLRGTPQASTVSLPHYSHYSRGSGVPGSGASPVQSPVHASFTLPFLFPSSAYPANANANPSTVSLPPKHPDDSASIRTVGPNPNLKQDPRPHPLVLNGSAKPASSPLREIPITASPAVHPAPASPPQPPTDRRSQSEHTEGVPMSPLARPQFPNMHMHNDGRPVSLAGSELSAPGLNRILTGFDEVDAQLHEMLTQRGRDLNEAVGSPDGGPASPIHVAIAV